jgi:hypothetical protein
MSSTDGTSGTARLHDWVASLLSENADLVEELRSSRTRIVEACNGSGAAWSRTCTMVLSSG